MSDVVPDNSLYLADAHHSIDEGHGIQVAPFVED